ncbi:M20 family metallopeptidase [Domibacillus tundrae]|uniref:M20 family metallopeptidase n=1 Tax=Domibacillus tundrae TaxID=1587527 RepID=UPI003392B4D3
MKESIVSLTRKLVEFRTVEKDRINAAAEYCSEWLAANGVHARVIDNEGLKSVVAIIGKEGPTIILNGHLDVVPAGPDQFIPYVADGKLYGRGSFDMLGSVAVMMHVMAELVQEELPCKVMLALVPDEEKGGQKGTKYLVEHGLIGDVVICGETTNLDIAVQAKGLLQLEIEIEGVSAHGSRPWLGDNAILNAVETYKKIEALPIFNVSTPYFEHPSLNLARIQAGQAINQVPDRCIMDLDIRYLPGQNPSVLLSEIKGVVNGTIRVLSEGEPVQTNPDHPLIVRLQKAAERICERNIQLFGQHGTADTRFYAARGIPAVEFGPCGANHHGKNEYVDTASLVTYKEVLTEYICGF